jgi:hypothetical protein
MSRDIWLESTTTALADILTHEYRLELDRAVLANILDRRRASLSRSWDADLTAAQEFIAGDELHEIAKWIGHAHHATSSVA